MNLKCSIPLNTKLHFASIEEPVFYCTAWVHLAASAGISCGTVETSSRMEPWSRFAIRTLSFYCFLKINGLCLIYAVLFFLTSYILFYFIVLLIFAYYGIWIKPHVWCLVVYACMESVKKQKLVCVCRPIDDGIYRPFSDFQSLDHQ